MNESWKKYEDVPTISGSQEKVFIGNNVALKNVLIGTICGYVFIGDDSFFGHNCILVTCSHDRNKFGEERKESHKDLIDNDIVIGNGVLIQSGSIILGPCKIGSNSFVSAGSVVHPGAYPEKSFLIGNPAEVAYIIEDK
jgi:acetyltransferase-like isoleucine patch superfamily enzyme